MAQIDIQREHGRSLKEARAAVERVAERIAENFGITHAWDGNTLDFHGSGVNGRIALAKHRVHVTATLGFLASAFRGSIESEINRHLDRELG
jgi:putative polyhydroxyalkanoate system protein